MLRPRRQNCHWTSKLQKWPQRTSDAPLNCKDLNCRLFLCASSSMSAPQNRRLQALAAAFAVVCPLSLLDEKCTADYSTRTLLSHKAAEDSAKFCWCKPTIIQFIVEWRDKIHAGFTLEKCCSLFYSLSLLEMWILKVYVGLGLPSWMNEIPFAQNIMRGCVRTPSRPVESLAPVKKKTRTVIFNAWWRLNWEIISIRLDFCLRQNAAACCSGVPCLKKSTALFFFVCLSSTVCTEMFLSFKWLRAVLVRQINMIPVHLVCVLETRQITCRQSSGKCSMKNGWCVCFSQ